MGYLYWQIGIMGIGVLYCIFALIFSRMSKKD
jgi:hypothetical protein